MVEWTSCSLILRVISNPYYMCWKLEQRSTENNLSMWHRKITLILYVVMFVVIDIAIPVSILFINGSLLGCILVSSIIFIFSAATGNIWDFIIRTGHNSRYITYFPISCVLSAKAWSWSEITLQCSESIFCIWQRCRICTGLLSSRNQLNLKLKLMIEASGYILYSNTLTESPLS